MASQKQASNFKKRVLLEVVEGRKVGDLIKQQELGTELSFAPAHEDIETIIRLWNTLLERDLERLPIGSLDALGGLISDCQGLFNELAGFKGSRPSAVSERAALISRAASLAQSLLDATVPALFHTEPKDQRIQDLVAGASLTVSERVAEIAAQKDEVAAIAEQAKAALLAAREASKQVGVSVHAEVFKNEADQHDKAALRWLWATGVCFFVLVVGAGAAIAIYWPRYVSPYSNIDPYPVQFGIAKLVLFSVVASLLAVCVRNYRAHQHNSVVNRHRQNALASFRTFAAGAADDATRDAVLIQATTSIFSPQQSGYTHGDDGDASPSKIIEIVRNVGRWREEELVAHRPCDWCPGTWVARPRWRDTAVPTARHGRTCLAT